MKTTFFIICALCLHFGTYSLANAEALMASANTGISTDSETNIKAVGVSAQTNANKTGKIDAVTSASVLSAKRSHQVAKQDELGLTVFMGVIILGIMGFFLKPFR